MYKTVIRPVLLYACETRSPNILQQARLGIWDRKVWKKIFGEKSEEEIWMRRANNEEKQIQWEW